jgi:hypothetical protein
MTLTLNFVLADAPQAAVSLDPPTQEDGGKRLSVARSVLKPKKARTALWPCR